MMFEFWDEWKYQLANPEATNEDDIQLRMPLEIGESGKDDIEICLSAQSSQMRQKAFNALVH